MRFYVISDNTDTITGLRLAGLKGVVVHKREEILKALDEAASDPETGIIIMTELLAERVKDVVRDIRLDSHKPIITVIPDRHGERRRPDYITSYIKEAIGLKI